MPRFLLLLLAISLLSACSSTRNIAQQDLLHHHWVLGKLDGQPIANDSANLPDIEIGEQLIVNGIAGCNRYFGQGHLEEDRFWVSSLGSTAMACEPGLNDVEQAVIATLMEGATLSRTPQTLILEGKQHRLEYRLRDWIY